jgi:hypothetical protein
MDKVRDVVRLPLIFSAIILPRVRGASAAEGRSKVSGEYGITRAPALFFLDTQGKLLWMGSGKLSENEIQEKLRLLGK